MLNNDELEQIGKVIETKLEAEREQTRKVIREEVEAAEKRLNTRLEVLTEDMASFFNQTWEKMEETNQRATTIEDHLGLPHPT